MTIRKFLIGSVAATALLTSGLALADNNRATTAQGSNTPQAQQRDGQRLDTRGQRQLAGLNLTADQQKRIEDIRNQYRSSTENQAQVRSRFENRQRQEQALLEAPVFDSNKARQLIAEQQREQAEQHLRRLQERHAIHQVLTPEQRQQMREQSQNRQQRAPHAGQRGQRGSVPKPQNPALAQ